MTDITGRDIANVGKAIFDTLTPDGETDRFIFRKFDGNRLAEVAESGGELSDDDITTVTLKINPEETGFSKPKITQKIQTSAPSRFVVLDWGTDLLALSIQGNTGNLLPGIVQSGFNPTKGVVNDLVDTVNPGYHTESLSTAFGAVTPYAQKIMLGSMTYFEILNMSPKYRAFVELQNLYNTFDADLDVLTLEYGETVLRGYFLDFNFTVTANSPWNWKYAISFAALTNLSESIRRGDTIYPAHQAENSSFSDIIVD